MFNNDFMNQAMQAHNEAMRIHNEFVQQSMMNRRRYNSTASEPIAKLPRAEFDARARYEEACKRMNEEFEARKRQNEFEFNKKSAAMDFSYAISVYRMGNRQPLMDIINYVHKRVNNAEKEMFFAQFIKRLLEDSNAARRDEMIEKFFDLFY